MGKKQQGTINKEFQRLKQFGESVRGILQESFPKAKIVDFYKWSIEGPFCVRYRNIGYAVLAGTADAVYLENNRRRGTSFLDDFKRRFLPKGGLSEVLAICTFAEDKDGHFFSEPGPEIESTRLIIPGFDKPLRYRKGARDLITQNKQKLVSCQLETELPTDIYWSGVPQW